jgi:hypothetical protein
MEKGVEAVSIFLGTILGLVVAGLILGFPIMWLWNWLMPVVFELPTIDFWQALGLWILSGAFFGHTSSVNK